MDEWQLPVTETAGTCEIGVQLLPYSIPEPTCWAEIQVVARRLSEVCRERVVLSDVTGGSIMAGPHRRIEISMARRKSGDGGKGG